MEHLVLRFPLVGRKIFKNFDNQDLAKVKEVSRILNEFQETNKSFWIRRLQKYNENHVEFKEAWVSVTKGEPVETVKQLAINVKEFYAKQEIKKTSAKCSGLIRR